MPKFEVTVCDGETCGVVKTCRDQEVAERALARELKKRAKKMRKERIPRGVVRGEVREVVRGVPADQAIYEGEERYGEPAVRRARRPRADQV